MIDISILGAVVVSEEGGERRVPPGKATELLIRLALEPGGEVRTDRLIDDLWGDESAERNTVQSKVSMLRRALGDSVAISGSRTGYTLMVDPDRVDATRLLSAAQRAPSVLSAGEPREALRLAQDALALFRGEVLPDAGDAAWVEPYRARLEAARLTLLDTRFTVAVELEPPGSTIGELENLVRQFPLHERFWELLVTALYRAQRQADALDAYGRVRDMLDVELGLEPGPRLRELERLVLNQDASLDQAADGTNRPPTAPVRGNLPGLTSDLVGRVEELGLLTELIADRRLVTIVGPAGVGKTRLAIEVAREADLGEAWLVRLEAATSSSELAGLVGDALGLNGATGEMVVERLSVMTGLVVIDNCEHVVDAVAAFASMILDRAPGVHLLATSKVPLDLDGEHVHVLRPLPVDDAVALFAARSHERRLSSRVAGLTATGADTESARAVEDVCRALDGLPLAIELAAARTKALSVEEIARRLDDRFALLSDRSARGPERHRALSAAISWSFDLLFPDEQQVLFAIAGFTDGAPLSGVEHVARSFGVPAPAVLDALGRLADRSLVTVDVGDAGAVRYRLLESVRAFALDAMAATDVLERANAEHAAWFAGQADGGRIDERGPRQAAVLTFVRAERANIDAALRWAAHHDPLLGVRIVRGFGWSWTILGEAQVAADRSAAALAAADEVVGLEDRAVILAHIAWNEAGADLERARVSADAATVAATASGSPDAVAESQFPLAFVMLQSGDALGGLAIVESWRSSRGAEATAWQLGVSCMVLGYCGLVGGVLEAAQAAADEGVALLPTLNDDWLRGHIESIRGQLALGDARLDDAASYLTDAARASRDAGLPAAEAFHLVTLGRVQQLSGSLDDAIATLESAAAAAESVGLMRVVAIAHVQLGRVLIGSGDLERAGEVLTGVSEWFAASGGGESAALVECLLATLPGGSTERLRELLADARSVDDLEVQVLCLDALALRDARAGDDPGAEVQLNEADELVGAVAHRVTPVDRVDAERARQLLATRRPTPRPARPR